MAEDEKLNPKTEPAEEEEEEEELPDDIRVQIIAGMLEKELHNYTEMQTVPDHYKGSYAQVSSLNSAISAILIAIPFFSTPGWCLMMEDGISGDCAKDQKGTLYHMSFLPIAPARGCLWVLVGLRLFVVIMQLWKWSVNKDGPRMWLLWLIFMILNASEIVIMIAMVLNWMPWNWANEAVRALTLTFVICMHKTLWEGVIQLLVLVGKSQQAIWLFFGNQIFFTILFRILLFNDKNVEEAHTKNEPIWTASRWDTPWHASWSLFCYGLGDNFPDLLSAQNAWETVVPMITLLFYGFWTANIIMSILTGYFADSFNGFYANMITAVLELEPELKYVMLKALEYPLLRPDVVTNLYRLYQAKGVEAVKAVVPPEAQEEDFTQDAPDPEEFDLTDVQNFEETELTFRQVYDSVPYAAVTTVLDMVIVFIPIYKLDTFTPNAPSKDMYLMAELLNSYVFAEAFMLSLRYREILLTKMYMFKLLTSIVLFMTSNYLQYIHYEVSTEEIMNHVVIFKMWCWACVFQFLGVHNLMAKVSSRWVTLIRAIRMTIPMLKDLLTIYLVILLIFAQIGMAVWGGEITANMKKQYDTWTGNDQDSKWLWLNFNDYLNSINFLFSLTFVANYMNQLFMAVLSLKTWGWQLFGCLYFFFYFFLGFLIVMNIIVGMVLGFITTYFGMREEAEVAKEPFRVPMWNRMFRIPRRVALTEDDDKKLA